MFKVLYVCIHNSARSQIAEAYTNYLSNGLLQAESAGIVAGSLNPYVVEVMKEEGIDISHASVNSVFDFYKQGKLFNYVITVCNDSLLEKCPVFPNTRERLSWSFIDPSSLVGKDESILKRTRRIRDDIKLKVLRFIDYIEEQEHKKRGCL